MKTAVLKVWLVLWASVGAVLLAWIFGFAEDVYLRDHSHISLAVAVLYCLNTYNVLQAVKKVNSGTLRDWEMKPYWFTSELLFGMGIIGNAVGLYLMLNPFFGADLSNATVKQALQTNVLIGIGTACVVTMLSVACSYALKYQLVLVEYALDAQNDAAVAGEVAHHAAA
jgi:F0F1-type ATP synthase membrane subunit c/vacuolar-type H+-ATPase subunit K